MSEFQRLLLLPALAMLGLYVSRHHGNLAIKLVRRFILVVAVAFLANVLTGLMMSQATAASMHKWLGHGLLIMVWLLAPFAIGVGVQTNLGKRTVVAIFQTLVLLLLFGAVTQACYTGYLGPSNIDSPSEEMANRFRVLHFFALPALITLLLSVAFWMYRSAESKSSDPI